MIEHKYLFRITSCVVVLSLLFGLLALMRIQYQFYVWEILIDLKVAAVLGLFLLAYKRKELSFTTADLSFFFFDWKKNILFFFAPMLIYSLSSLIGILAKTVSFTKMDNAATLVLATFFDIPALYVFSATTILIEELIFRGLLLRSFELTLGVPRAIFVTSSLWMIFVVTEIVGLESFDPFLCVTCVLFFLSVGFLLSVLSFWKRNVWFGYSFRIGLITLTPILLTSRINESDSFLTTESLFFIAEGVSVSFIICIFAWFIYRQSYKINVEQVK